MFGDVSMICSLILVLMLVGVGGLESTNVFLKITFTAKTNLAIFTMQKKSQTFTFSVVFTSLKEVGQKKTPHQK